ncbi:MULTISPECIES: NAD(P)-dependent oxidoreductase [unclassified Brenneria]|uniref:NAD(P)-dependent oxidoreductase n=1 Tax=unclassified Brenneria TaxID=2634434 RepID=UPI001551E35B|nr:NAD(P)-dependent oxidoreductase [Brenneria sp. hezel4-2-4]MEE3649788.1 NAD(P)-dependent oxidoreductase [Brenneria sp. HEZEL_4_2_4]NPC99747.1 bifunctional glyoxylate/hydroxypyruvate reductase B [Brenneria sp. hezel4-2-4]
MKQPVVLYKKIPQDLLQHLEERFDVRFFDGINTANQAEVIRALADAKGMIGASVPVREALLNHAPQLKAISTISVGYDQFDVEDLTRRGIVLMHTPTVLTETTADTVFTLILMTARRAQEMAELVKAGRWQRSIGSEYYGTDVHHKTIGILGMGRIGSAVARRASAGFGMQVLYWNDRRNLQVEQTLGARRCDLDTLLANADFVVVTLPYDEQTHHLINAARLGMMKPGAILINGSRGRIVDQPALIDALKNGVIRGAGLDVFEVEPLPVDSELLTLSNVVALPHIGSATHETRHNMAACAVDNLINALNGDITENSVNGHLIK